MKKSMQCVLSLQKKAGKETFSTNPELFRKKCHQKAHRSLSEFEDTKTVHVCILGG